MSCVLAEGITPRSKLPSLTGLTQQGVHKVCDALIQKSYLKLGSPEISGRGKPSPRISIDTERYVSAGVSISTDSLRYCLLDLSGRPLIEETKSSPRSDPTSVAKDLAIRLDHWRKTAKPECEVIGIGIGMQGFRTGAPDVFLPPDPLTAWGGVPLTSLFQEYCNLPVFADNNASASAIAESYLGENERHSCTAFLSFNFGFGAGISWLNKPFQGGHGNAGEISALFSQEDLPNRPALGSLIKLLQSNSVDIDTVDDLARIYDPNLPGVSEWLDRVQPTMQSAIRALQATIDPEVIFFGGEAPPELRQALIEISRGAFHDPRLPSPKLKVSSLLGDPAHFGAALLPLHQLIYV